MVNSHFRGAEMDRRIETWHEDRTKVPPGQYLLKCVEADNARIWYEGRGGWGRSGKIILWFEIFQGDHAGKVVPMFLSLGNQGKISQGSKYFACWCVANGLRRPSRNRLKEMSISKFLDKVFDGEIVDVRPKYASGKPRPDLFSYSRVDILYELVLGNPDT
jgi:hypothetical protein